MKEILEKVQKGELTPEQAEAELKRQMAEAPRTGVTGDPEPVGQLVQYTPGDESTGAFIGIAGFTVLHVLFDLLTVYWIVNRLSQREASLWAAGAFLTLGLVLVLYMKSFMPDEIIVKKRRWKYVPRKNEPWSALR